MRNFESKIFSDLEKDDSYRKARETLASEAIDIETFVDLYGEDNVARDQTYVERMEREFKRTKTSEQAEFGELAAVFEAIILEQTELNEWLGPDTDTIKTSRYDDIKNGVDSIAEIRETESAASYLALAIDVTFNADTRRKLDRIQKEIETGELARVKYFASEHMNIRGELSRMPRVVIGADKETVKELSRLWLERDNKELAKHWIQFQIIEEVLMQLKIFRRYARKIGKEDVVEVYDKAITLVEEIFEEKKMSQFDNGIRDKVFASIKTGLADFGK
jgi:hypothetical protein